MRILGGGSVLDSFGSVEQEGEEFLAVAENGEEHVICSCSSCGKKTWYGGVADDDPVYADGVIFNVKKEECVECESVGTLAVLAHFKK